MLHHRNEDPVARKEIRDMLNDRGELSKKVLSQPISQEGKLFLG